MLKLVEREFPTYEMIRDALYRSDVADILERVIDLSALDEIDFGWGHIRQLYIAPRIGIYSLPEMKEFQNNAFYFHT